jgi:hypothetical protein
MRFSLDREGLGGFASPNRLAFVIHHQLGGASVFDLVGALAAFAIRQKPNGGYTQS